MKVFLSVKYHADLGNADHVHHLVELLAFHRMQAVCGALESTRDALVHFTPDELMRHTFTTLRACKLVVVDLSEKGVGIGIEAGYATARGIPVITLAPAGADVSETLSGISQSVFWYHNWDELNWFLGEVERRFVPQGDA